MQSYLFHITNELLNKFQNDEDLHFQCKIITHSFLKDILHLIMEMLYYTFVIYWFQIQIL